MGNGLSGRSRSRALAVALGLVLACPVTWFVYSFARTSAQVSTVAFADSNSDAERLVFEPRDPAGADLASDRSIEDTDEFLLRIGMSEEAARYFYPTQVDGRQVYDRIMSSRLAPNLRRRRSLAEHPRGGWFIRTNSLGLRNDEELADPAPSLRIVVTGDSHVEGVCSNAENLCHQLALHLREAGIEDAEVLNSGVGGYDIYNYVGVVEARAVLEPDLFIVIVYGGNDFQGAMYIRHYHHQLGPPKRGPWSARAVLKQRGDKSGVMSQELFQALYFLNNPEEEAIAVTTARSACMEMERLAEAAGARVLFVYLPPPFTAQPALYAEERDGFVELLGLPPGSVEVSDRIADLWLSGLRERHLNVVDLRATFARRTERLYWSSDHHLNLAGHALVAEVLDPIVRELADPRR